MIRTEREYRKAVRRLDAAAAAEAIASRGLTEDEAKRALDHLVRAIRDQLLKEVEGYERLTAVDDAEASRRAAREPALAVCPRCLGRPATRLRPATDSGAAATLASILLSDPPARRAEADRCPECGGWLIWTGWWPPTPGAKECSYCLRFGLRDGAGI